MGVRETVTRVADSSTGIAVSMAIMNFSTYGFAIVASPLLGTEGYGAVAASLNLLLVVSVGALGLQATAARRISAEPHHVAQIERSILRVTYRAAAALGVLMLLVMPLIQRLLNLDTFGSVLVIAVSAVPITLAGGFAGILQGERRWAALGLLYVASGLPRLLIGAAFIFWQPTEFWALVGVALSYWAPVLVGWWALRHGRQPGVSGGEHTGWALLRESITNGQALFAFFALSSVDIIVARNVMTAHDAGLYAGGMILAKAMLFLPQFVVIVAFPSMATGHERKKALVVSLSLVVALGAAGTLAAWLLSGIAVRFIGGLPYAEVESQLWLFAILGTLLSMIQLLVYSVLARQGSASLYAVWAALAALVGIGLTTDTVIGLVGTVVAVDGALLLVLLAVSVWVLRQDQPAPERPDTVVA